MDKLREKLRHDAAQIDASIPRVLDERICASLEGVELHTDAGAQQRSSRTFRHWWYSGLAGVASVVAIAFVFNIETPEPKLNPENSVGVTADASQELDNGIVALAGSLQKEVDDLQADISKVGAMLSEGLPLNLWSR